MDQNGFMMNGGPQQNHMMRPQPGNEQEQIHAKIMDTIHKTPVANGTWQATIDDRERANYIMQLVTGLRMLNPDLVVCIGIATKFESQAIQSSANKDQWLATLRAKSQEITTARQRKMQSMMQNNGQPPNMQQPPGPMMNQMGMQPNMSNQGAMSNGFPAQLQHPMQASPLNIPQQAMNMDQPSVQPNMTPQNQAARPAAVPSQSMSRDEQAQVMRLAQQMFNQCPREQADAMRQQIMANSTPQQQEQHQRSGQDPVQRHFINQAIKRFQQQKSQAAAQASSVMQNPQNQMNQSSQGMAGPNMQRTLSQAPQQNNSQGNQDIDFSAFVGQQADALRMQESGQVVVPASSNPAGVANLGNGQVNMGMGGQGQQNMNGVNSMGNANGANGMQNMNGMNNMATVANMAGMANMANMNNQNPYQMQQMMAQRQAQAARQAQLNAHAQAQAQAQVRNNAQNVAQQQMQLRGQPGGLTANAQQPQPSPAMSMLNRPLVPPGQQGNATPQQRPAQTSPPQVTPQMAPQNMAQMQSMNNAQNQFAGQKMPLQFPPSMPLHVRQKLATMPEEQARSLIQQFIAREQQARQQRNAQQPNPQMGMPMNQPAMGNNAGVPNDNQQFPQSMMQDQQMLAGGDMQQRQLQHAMAQRIDHNTFPPKLLEELKINVPEGIATWVQLREYVALNQANMQPGTMDRLRKLQFMVFSKQHGQAQANNLGMQNTQNMGGMPSQQPTVSGPMSGVQQSVPAPPAQMLPQQAQPHTATRALSELANNISNIPVEMRKFLQPTPQDMMSLRNKLPNAQTMTDEQVRNTAMQMKYRSLRQSNPALVQQHEMQEHARQAQAQAQAQSQAQAHAQAQAQAQTQANIQRPGQQQQRQQSRNAPPPQMQNAQAQAQNNRMPASQRQETQGQKGPPNGRAPEGPTVINLDQSPPKSDQPQLEPRPIFRPQQRMSFTPEQIATMTPEQKNQLRLAMQKKATMEALKNAQGQAGRPNQSAPQQPQPTPPLPQSHGQQQGQQQASQQQSQAQPQQMNSAQARLRARSMIHEVDSSTPKGPAVDADHMEQSIERLQALLPQMHKLEQSIPVALGIFGEEVVRKILIIRATFFHQLNRDGSVKDFLSVDPEGINAMAATVRKYLTSLMMKVQHSQGAHRQASMQGQQQAQQGQQISQGDLNRPQQQQQPVPQQQSGHISPGAQDKPRPGLANTGRKMSGQQAMQRKASSTKIPSAPTSAEPPFAIGAASPHGVPVYDGKPVGFTADKLQLPTQKKRKTNAAQSGSTASTPAGQIGTPAMASSPQITTGKTPSPEHKRQRVKLEQAAAEREMPEKRFKCKDEMCEYSIQGFEDESDLQKHLEKEHPKIEDPLQFMLDGARAFYKLGPDGKALPKAATTSSVVSRPPTLQPKPSSLAPATMKKSGPARLKEEGALTPGAASASPSAQAKRPLSSQTPNAAAAQTKQAEPTATTGQSLREVMATKMGYDKEEVDKCKTIDGTDTATSTTAKSDDNEKDNRSILLESIRIALTEVEGLVPLYMMESPQFAMDTPKTPALTDDDTPEETSTRTADGKILFDGSINFMSNDEFEKTACDKLGLPYPEGGFDALEARRKKRQADAGAAAAADGDTAEKKSIDEGDDDAKEEEKTDWIRPDRSYYNLMHDDGLFKDSWFSPSLKASGMGMGGVLDTDDREGDGINWDDEDVFMSSL